MARNRIISDGMGISDPVSKGHDLQEMVITTTVTTMKNGNHNCEAECCGVTVIADCTMETE